VEPTLFVAFVTATTLLMLLPGPNVTLIMSNSIARGARNGVLTALGGSVAIALHLLIVFAGLLSLMATLGGWMEWLRWAGVAYLLWLGWRALREGDDDVGTPLTARDSRRALWQGFLVASTNPKLLLFYAAFFPQFIALDRAPVQQLVVLGVVFVLIQILCDTGYALLAGRFARHLRRGRWRQRLSGGLLLATGIGLALARR
jgi:threonine/homoserine/homoserine lactone efflux protein